MDSPRSGSPNRSTSVELLRVETDLFDLYIKGKPFHPTAEALQLHRDGDNWVPATLQVSALDKTLQTIQIQAFSPVEQKLTDFTDHNYPCFYEHQNYEVVIQAHNPDRPLQFHHENALLRDAVKPIGSGKGLLTGILNFKNEVGYTDFEIREQGRPLLQVRLEVFPSKMDYKTDYENILHDVNEQVYNLAFDFLRRTYTMTGTMQPSQPQTFTEFFSILRGIFDHLVRSVERIQNAPHHRLQQERREVVADKVKRAGRDNHRYLQKRPHLLAHDPVHGILPIGGTRYQPTKLLETKRQINYDTAENRFVRFALCRIQAKLKDMRKRFTGNQNRRRTRSDAVTSDWLSMIDRMQSHLDRLLRLDFLQGVGEMKQMSLTLVLQMAPGYRDVYRDYLLLHKGLSLQGDLFRLSLKDVAQLYEYWCFLKLHSLFKKHFTLLSQDIVRIKHGSLFVMLDNTSKAKSKFLDPKTGEEFTLFYNRAYHDGPTLGQKPDNVLMIHKQSSRREKTKQTYQYVFDAKYRINPAFEGTEYKNVYRTPGPEVDDINTMHRYRDAIVHDTHQDGTYERQMFGAYVLFPYHDEDQFREHHFYQSIRKVNVGALPFLPGSTELVETFLQELIQDSPEKAFERSTQSKGTQSYFQDKLSTKNVLIGSLGDEEQWDVNREHRFYHMPLKNLKKKLDALSNLQWIGVYFSKKFYKAEAGIHWIGRITEWNVVKRSDITERSFKPGNGEELYVRFEIEEWEQLQPPIEPYEKGVRTCLLTTDYLLNRATNLGELRIESPAHLQDWRELRRQGNLTVSLDHSYVDEATEVLRIEVTEPTS
ncbi:restriction endonuclease-like protein [Tumebacillus sp. ITR2]|uniref:Restriction endonuclease-like protein n=1 Tax=Tumebacillus amylolyticus TaxID=2801339 RepID=A0ABS1J6K7_9BACL|nr:restriction endonuclease-like protein [Tumebacillus amylolyticus]MBL0385917.1 restriction endonuclease-like protein [Tumebacillus amylolyticus]